MTSSPTTSTPDPDLGAGPQSRPRGDLRVLPWLVAATFVVILNETILVNAIPRLTAELGVDERTGQWLTSAFMLTMAVVIPVTGWFLQRVTTRQAFGTAMAVFALGTGVAAVAPSFELLLLGRVVQAAGTAVMMPLLMTTLMTVVPAHDRGRVMGNVTLAMSVAPALGPTVSGLILHVASWRWLFIAVLPVAVGLALLGLRRLVDVGQTRPGGVDWPSVALSALGFGPLVYGLSQLGGGHGGDGGSGPVPAWAGIVVGLAAVAAFVLRQLALQRRADVTPAPAPDGRGRGGAGGPLLDLRVLRHRTFTIGLLLMSLAFMAMLGSMVLLPFYLQGVLGLDELGSGLLVMPGGLAMGLLGPRVGRLFDRVGGRPLVVPGAVGVAVALALLSQVAATTALWQVVVVHLLLMISLAAVFTPVFTLSLGALPPHLYPHGSSMLGALQQVAAAAGTAVVIAVLSARSAALAAGGAGPVEAYVGGLRWGFAVGAVLALGVVALAVAMPGRVPGEAAGPEGNGSAEAPLRD